MYGNQDIGNYLQAGILNIHWGNTTKQQNNNAYKYYELCQDATAYNIS